MYDALGVRFTLRCDDPDLAAHLADVLSGLEVGEDLAAASGPVEFQVPEHEARLPGAAARVIGMVNLRAVDGAAGSLLLHAGAVSRPDGGSMILCGPSGSGKSTLTAILSSRHAYLTDESVCVDPHSLRITPFRKPLALKSGALELMPHFRPETDLARRHSRDRVLVPPARLGGPPPPPQPLLPELIVFPTWSPGSDLEVEELTAPETAYLLGTSASHLESVDGGPLPALARLARRTPAHRIRFDDPWEAASVLDELWDLAS